MSRDFPEDSYVNEYQDSDDKPLHNGQDYNENSDRDCDQNSAPQNLGIGQQQNSTVICDQHKNNTQTGLEEQTKNEQVETRNLPKLFGGLIYKAFKKHCCLYKKSIKHIKYLLQKKLREFISNKDVRDFSLDYISSNEILYDILRLEKQKNIGVPIKYLKKIYLGCKDPNELYSWKQ